MKPNNSVKVVCNFVSAGQKDGKKAWVRLSDGIDSAFFTTDLELSSFADLERGQEVEFEFEVNLFDKYGTKIVDFTA